MSWTMWYLSHFGMDFAMPISSAGLLESSNDAPILIQPNTDNTKAYKLPARLRIQVVCIEAKDGYRQCFVECVEEQLAKDINHSIKASKIINAKACHLSIDLANDFAITCFDPKRLHYSMPDLIPASILENVASFSICEPYFLQYATPFGTAWHSCLRRMTITFTNQKSHNGSGLEWRMTAPNWEEKVEMTNAELPHHVERATRADIEKDVVEPLMFELHGMKGDSDYELLTPEILWRLQKNFTQTQADQRLAEKAFLEKQDVPPRTFWLGTIKRDAPLRTFQTNVKEDDRQDEDYVDVDDVDGTRYILKTRAEAARRYRTAEWKGNTTIWRPLS